MTTKAGERLCSYGGCGRPENDRNVHPGPGDRMGFGRHVFRSKDNPPSKASELRTVLAEDGWGEGSLAMRLVDDALAEARAAVLAELRTAMKAKMREWDDDYDDSVTWSWVEQLISDAEAAR